MSYIIAYQERALKEYELAIEWYREHSESAAQNFEVAVKEKIDILRAAPESYKNTYRKFREVVLKKYPYSILYIIEAQTKTIIIFSIYHHKRNPRKKYK